MKEKLRIIAELEAVLRDRKKVLAIIKDELAYIKDKYGDTRKTKIVKTALGEFSQEDVIANEEAIITLTQDGYIKRMNPSVKGLSPAGRP